MREFIIGSLEKLLNIVVFLTFMLAFGLAAFVVASQGNDGFISAIGIMVVGYVLTVLIAGTVYLLLGIYHNTKRTAVAMEMLAKK